MPFHAALSTDGDLAQALDAVCAEIKPSLGDAPDLLLAFFSLHHLNEADTIATTLHERLGPHVMLGCCGEAIIGRDQEIEQDPALSVWAGKWTKSIKMAPFHLRLERTSEGPSILGWPEELLSADAATSVMLLLGDPFTFPTDVFLNEMNNEYKGLRVMGGMASSAPGPGRTRLLRDGQALDQGAVGVLIQGDVQARSIVSQGCRPVGKPMVITKAEQNVIRELGGESAVARLQETWQSLTPHEQELFQQGPHVGRVINEYQDKFERGDFLVRNLVGLDRDSGAIAITDFVRVGQTVQFHVRDADTADEDLRALLQRDRAAHPQSSAAGLIFSCNGRGTRLFEQPHHDARAVWQECGELPLAGFFAAGELGPVGGQNFIHGFTASVVLFEGTQ